MQAVDFVALNGNFSCDNNIDRCRLRMASTHFYGHVHACVKDAIGHILEDEMLLTLNVHFTIAFCWAPPKQKVM